MNFETCNYGRNNSSRNYAFLKAYEQKGGFSTDKLKNFSIIVLLIVAIVVFIIGVVLTGIGMCYGVGNVAYNIPLIAFASLGFALLLVNLLLEKTCPHKNIQKGLQGFSIGFNIGAITTGILSSVNVGPKQANGMNIGKYEFSGTLVLAIGAGVQVALCTILLCYPEGK